MKTFLKHHTFRCGGAWVWSSFFQPGHTEYGVRLTELRRLQEGVDSEGHSKCWYTQEANKDEQLLHLFFCGTTVVCAFLFLWTTVTRKRHAKI